jgi:hypothetical protein
MGAYISVVSVLRQKGGSAGKAVDGILRHGFPDGQRFLMARVNPVLRAVRGRKGQMGQMGPKGRRLGGAEVLVMVVCT